MIFIISLELTQEYFYDQFKIEKFTSQFKK